MVEIATPDHWHALPMIAACKAGVVIYVQKPISVDVVEGQAMLAAARKYGRVVQVGTQRRSTPHLIEAREELVKSGKLGKVGTGRDLLLRGVDAPCRCLRRNQFRLSWTTTSGRGRHRCFRTTRFASRTGGHSGSTATGGWGTWGFTCWIWHGGSWTWVGRSGSRRLGGVLVNKGGFANITDTQTAMFEFDDLNIVWQHRSWGIPPNPKNPWAGTFYGDKGTLTAGVLRYDFIPAGQESQAIHKDVTYELDKYPEDNTEAAAGEARSASDSRPYEGSSGGDEDSGASGGGLNRHRHISTGRAGVLANLSLELGRTLTWDAKAGKVVGDEEANRRLRRAYPRAVGAPEVGAV